NIEKEIESYLSHTIANAIEVEVHPAIASILCGSNGEYITKVESNFNKKLSIRSVTDLKHDAVKIKEVDINTIVC
ncbi:MAG: RNAse, partial [Clostridiales bacterium]|nr:RNAse [Clostridiales bacterium]